MPGRRRFYDEQPCHAIDAQPVQPTVSHSRDAKLQPDDETAVNAALLERTRADALKELALEMTETMIQNVHKLNDKQSLDLTPHQNEFEVNPLPANASGGTADNPIIMQKRNTQVEERTLINAFVTWDMNDNVALTLWGKNLTDEVKRVSANPVGTLWNFARYAPPRSIGVKAAFNF